MFEKTPRQKEAIKLLGSDAKNVLLLGGSRSGKTFILCYALFVRAMKAPKTRHLILRKHFKNAKTGIWHDTIPKVASIAFKGLELSLNKQDWFIELPNKSQIWIGGLDDKERSEKILGTEYSTIYFNECSELSYDSIQIAMTRLAQKSILKNKLFFDCNPPNKRHWSYRLFVENLDPISGEKRNSKYYASLLMNPKDNQQNLPEGYIEETLGQLSHRQRLRFELGEWLDDVEGAMWNYELINPHRVKAPPPLKNIVVAIDPAITNKATSDETGIIVVGKSEDDHYYVLDDFSGRNGV